MDRIDYARNEYAAQVLATYYGRVPRVFVRSYGCQQNVNDGERLKGVLFDIGFSLQGEPDNADLIIFNTCAVREHAEQRVLGNIGALKLLKVENPKMILALCGCMGESPEAVEKIRKSYPFVDLVFGTNYADKLPDLLVQKLVQGHHEPNPPKQAGVRQAIVEKVPQYRESGFKAFLPIMYGCDNFCTYCIVPYVRGRERSRNPQDILQEFRTLLASGYKEITLLGQNVNSYGKGLEEDVDFSDLLEMICQIDGAYKLRFMTSHPKDASHKLIDTMAKYEQICKHIHLPVQSGSNAILQKMNRGYTAQSYAKLVDYARKTCPQMTFSSDILIGFPGETEEDFEKTVSLVKQIKFTQIFTFIYSKRSGTKAADLEDVTPHEIKASRLNALLKLQSEIVKGMSPSWVGKEYEALVDGKGRAKGSFAARMDNNLLVEFDTDGQDKSIQIGQFVRVKITGIRGSILLGDLI